MQDSDRVGITPKSWTSRLHRGVLHLGKRWYVISAHLDSAGHADGVRLDGPFSDHEVAAREVARLEAQDSG